jgi:DNA repair protein RecO (recombination protein O)
MGATFPFMPQVSTPAIVLSALRYSETSKIVRLATRDYGVQSVIAKGALRARSRFGAALQLLSEGQAHLLLKEHRELHILTAFDLRRLHVGLAVDLERYAVACALAEVMLRFAPADPHPDSFDLLRQALDELELAARPAVEALGYRLLWQLVSVLGFAPSLDACVIDGTPLPPAGPLPFSTRDGGALCPTCAARHGATQLPEEARTDLVALLDPTRELPAFDEKHGAAHRRLLARYIRYHLAEGAELPALEFWTQRPWVAA